MRDELCMRLALQGFNIMIITNQNKEKVSLFKDILKQAVVEDQF